MNLSIGKIYTFNTMSPAFLGAVITQAKLKSIVDAATARKFAPIDQVYAQIYPSLPVNTPYDIENTVFYVFEGLNKSEIVLAETWIVETSIEVVEHITIKVNIPRASLSDVALVRSALTAAGLSGFAITTE